MKIGQRIMRFGIKKLSIGVVSVAVGFAFLAPAGISANEVKQDVTSEVATSVLNTKEELREPENVAPKLETPLTEETRRDELLNRFQKQVKFLKTKGKSQK